MIGKLLGKGKTAEVFAWDTDLALKLFYKGHEDDARKEYENALCIQNLDIPVAKCYGKIEADHRMGILYERIDGFSSLELFLKEKNICGMAKQLAETHKTMLRCMGTGLPNYKDILQKNILRAQCIAEGEKQQILKILAELPSGDRLCHGDFHPDNLLYSNEAFWVIDFMNVACGHPVLDIARTVFLLKYVPAEGAEDTLRDALTTAYIKEMDMDVELLDRSLIVIAAARAGEMQHDEEECRVAMEYLQSNFLII